MSNTINFNIVSGAEPFEVELIGSLIPKTGYFTTGNKQINNVPNGIYTLKITDSNGCEYQEEVVVDPNYIPTTTTTLAPNSIIIGHTQSNILIFNPDGTNINGKPVGNPDSDVVKLYLWFKTNDGKPLENNKYFSYNISADNLTGGTEFQYSNISDEIHCEVTQEVFGKNLEIYGNLRFRPGFIETYFSYIYYKGSVSDDYTIEIASIKNDIYTNLNTRNDDNVQYGIDVIENDYITLKY